jgi:hypothetical protein
MKAYTCQTRMTQGQLCAALWAYQSLPVVMIQPGKNGYQRNLSFAKT